MLVGVRVQLLRLPAKGALDRRDARGLRDPKDIIGVTHPQSLPGRSQVLCRSAPQFLPIMWWGLPGSATRDCGPASGRGTTSGPIHLARPFGSDAALGFVACPFAFRRSPEWPQ